MSQEVSKRLGSAGYITPIYPIYKYPLILTIDPNFWDMGHPKWKLRGSGGSRYRTTQPTDPPSAWRKEQYAKMLAELRPKAEAAVPWKIVGSDPWGPGGWSTGVPPAPDLPYEK